MAKTEEITPLAQGSETLHSYSRFFGQDLYLDNNAKFWGTWEPVEIPPSPSDIYFTVTSAEEGRLDLIAYRFYRTPELWWVIAEANNLFFVPEDVKTGAVLRVPSFTTVASLNLVR